MITPQSKRSILKGESKAQCKKEGERAATTAITAATTSSVLL
jgi:hypothetical protein